MSSSSITTAEPAQATPAPSTRPAARVAAVAAAVFAVSFFLTVAVINVPHDASDARLVRWWHQGVNVDSSLWSLGFAVVTALAFAVVVNHLQSRLRPHEAGSALAAFARSTGGAFTTLLLVSAAVRGVFGHMVRLDSEPLPGAEVLRYSTELNYTLMGSVVMGTCALTILALADVERRTGILPRWHSVVGYACGAIMLTASLVGFGQFTVPLAIVWGLSSAVAIWRTPVAVG
jgi:hypothetical protein